MKTPKIVRSASAARPVHLDLIVKAAPWLKRTAVLSAIRKSARLALAEGRGKRFASRAGHLGVTLLLTNDRHLAALNEAFRGKSGPTNVLSFPALAPDGGSLGDIALAYGTVAREARLQGKPLAAHAAHLTTHGILHLFGWNHEKPAERKAMEALETQILARMGVADPYAPRPYTDRRKAA